MAANDNWHPHPGRDCCGHPVTATVPLPSGWRCPGCQHAYAPSVTECPRCPRTLGERISDAQPRPPRIGDSRRAGDIR